MTDYPKLSVKFDLLQLTKNLITQGKTSLPTPTQELVNKIMNSQLFDLSTELLRIKNIRSASEEEIVRMFKCVNVLRKDHSTDGKFEKVERVISDQIRQLHIVESRHSGKRVLLSSVLHKIDEKTKRESTILADEYDLIANLEKVGEVFYQKSTILVNEHEFKTGGALSMDFKQLFGDLLKGDVLIMEALMKFLISRGLPTEKIVNSNNIKTYDFNTHIVGTYNESENVIYKDLLDACEKIVNVSNYVDSISYKFDKTNDLREFEIQKTAILKMLEEREKFKNEVKEHILTKLTMMKPNKTLINSIIRRELTFSETFSNKILTYIQTKVLSHHGIYGNIDYIFSCVTYLRFVFWKNIMFECLSVLL